MTAQRLVGLLAERERLLVFAAVALGAATPADVAHRTGLEIRTVTEALRRLIAADAVTEAPSGLVVRPEVFKEAARRAARRGEQPSVDPDRRRSAVLRAFLVDGRLISIPALRSKRRVVLEHIAATFSPGVRYPERDVDAALRAWYPDHAALRRFLVDEQLLARDHGVYWRVGGPVDIAPAGPAQVRDASSRR